MLTDHDLYLFNEGSHFRLYDGKLGAYPAIVEGQQGTRFAVWAPNAERVALIGDMNDWNPEATPMQMRGEAGIWEVFVPGVGPGTKYKYHIWSRHDGYRVDKADPFGFLMEEPPSTASTVWDLSYAWGDAAWMKGRKAKNALDAPISAYEVHLGSWMRGEGDRKLGYREIAPRLIEHCQRLGFTHVELMPVMEHPFYGSWGYQVTGYFAPSRRYGTPQDLMWLIDQLHQAGIGVLLDWVPGHFPSDAHGLGYFDGTHLFEHADPRQGWHPEWNSFIFNYSRHEVRSFLLSNALFWLDRYHADGLRIDGVASMLFLDYARKEGEWVPNVHGGRENLDAVTFLRRLNEAIRAEVPDAVTIAEDSTAWPLVTRHTDVGGLGFHLKWDMGWMHDTLRYLGHEPIHRKFHHNEITFRSLYQFNECFQMPLSHDEVVHGKGSLPNKMSGDWWQKRANLRLLFGHQFAQPGKKLVFMGGEFGQTSEWNHDRSLDWHLLDYEDHRQILAFVSDLAKLYRDEPALHRGDCDPRGFEWIDGSDVENSVIAYLRRVPEQDKYILVACNFTPVPRHDYALGVPVAGRWEEVLNSDAAAYGGSGIGNFGGVDSEPESHHGRPHRVRVTLPPLAIVLLRGPSDANTRTQAPRSDVAR